MCRLYAEMSSSEGLVAMKLQMLEGDIVSC